MTQDATVSAMAVRYLMVDVLLDESNDRRPALSAMTALFKDADVEQGLGRAALQVSGLVEYIEWVVAHTNTKFRSSHFHAFFFIFSFLGQILQTVRGLGPLAAEAVAVVLPLLHQPALHDMIVSAIRFQISTKEEEQAQLSVSRPVVRALDRFLFHQLINSRDNHQRIVLAQSCCALSSVLQLHPHGLQPVLLALQQAEDTSLRAAACMALEALLCADETCLQTAAALVHSSDVKLRCAAGTLLFNGYARRMQLQPRASLDDNAIFAAIGVLRHDPDEDESAEGGNTEQNLAAAGLARMRDAALTLLAAVAERLLDASASSSEVADPYNLRQALVEYIEGDAKADPPAVQRHGWLLLTRYFHFETEDMDRFSLCFQASRTEAKVGCERVRGLVYFFR